MADTEHLKFLDTIYVTASESKTIFQLLDMEECLHGIRYIVGNLQEN